MSRRTRGHRRLQPYSWLGAGAVTLGMGAALVGGSAVAFADTGTDAGSGSSVGSSASASTDAGSTKSEAPKRRGSAAASSASTTSASSASTRRSTDAADIPAVQVRNSAPAAAAATRRGARGAAVATVSQSNDVAAVQDSPAVSTAPAASANPAAADPPAPSMEGYLPGAGANPGNQIIPGQHFTQALAEIKATQGLLTQATFGSGNIIAGIGSLGPQALLVTAQLALQIWAGTIGGVQDFLAKTANIPLVKWAGRAAVFNELLVPTVSDFTLGVAAKLIPTLGWVGADVTAAEATVTQARQDGKIYAVVPVRVKLGTEPTVKAKLNGGANATLLVDTGASGVVTTRDKIGTAALGPVTGGGESCFSGGICYHYDTYDMTVDLGNGATTTAPVNIVTDTVDDPDSVKNFKDFFAWGADGILGVGVNTAGPGPVPIPTASMPGELSDGVLIHQSVLPLGLGGLMILGPNLLPTKVSLPGAPDAFLNVKVGNGAVSNNGAIIDSGGVYGTVQRSDVPAGINLVTVDGVDYLPAGVTITGYAPDGTTKLYSYKTVSQGTPVINEGLINTGNAPYAQNPIYLNYAFDNPYGIGSTDFSIW